MSWKIYNGYRVKSDLEGFYESLSWVSPKMNKEANLLFKDVCTNKIMSIIDFNDISFEDASSLVCKESNNAFTKINSGIRSVDYDFTFKVSFKPHDDGFIYVFIYSESSELTDLFLSLMSDLEEFYYWNNTESPEEFSDEIWEHSRGDVWRSLLTSSTAEASGFLSYSIISTDNLQQIKSEDDLSELIVYNLADRESLYVSISIEEYINSKCGTSVSCAIFEMNKLSNDEIEYLDLKIELKEKFYQLNHWFPG